MVDTRNSTYRSYDYFKMHSQKLAAAHSFFNISALIRFSQNVSKQRPCTFHEALMYRMTFAEISIKQYTYLQLIVI